MLPWIRHNRHPGVHTLGDEVNELFESRPTDERLDDLDLDAEGRALSALATHINRRVPPIRWLVESRRIARHHGPVRAS